MVIPMRGSGVQVAVITACDSFFMSSSRWLPVYFLFLAAYLLAEVIFPLSLRITNMLHKPNMHR